MADYLGQTFINIRNKIFNVDSIESISTSMRPGKSQGQDIYFVNVHLENGKHVCVFEGDSHSVATFVDNLWQCIKDEKDEIGL